MSKAKQLWKNVPKAEKVKKTVPKVEKVSESGPKGAKVCKVITMIDVGQASKWFETSIFKRLSRTKWTEQMLSMLT